MDTLEESLWGVSQNSEVLMEYFHKTLSVSINEDRMKIVRNNLNSPNKFPREANIIYIAPADAQNTCLSDASIDVHFSSKHSDGGWWRHLSCPFWS